MAVFCYCYCRAFWLVALGGILSSAIADDPYKYFTWQVSWGTISPLGVPQTGILINGQFPGPEIACVTNDNIVVNVINHLDEFFLLTWSGVQQRKNSWQDGVMGTNCRIPPGKNFTYKFQVKDQIGSFFYFPSTYYHRAAGGFGGLKISSRPLIPVPFESPAEEITLLMGDWYKTNHSVLRRKLDKGRPLPNPDGVLINGLTNYTKAVEQGKTYRFRISNVGLASSLNFMIQGHKLLLVEVEGTHTVQNLYDSLDIHVGQSCSVLVTMDQPPKDYSIAISTRFTNYVLKAYGVIHYSNSQSGVQRPITGGPPPGIEWSLNQARTIRTNLTASAARPNPQGSYHYGNISISRSIVLENSEVKIGGKKLYAVNSVSFRRGPTPLKLADYYNVSGVFILNGITDHPSNVLSPRWEATALDVEYKTFVEIVFQNNENSIQSWHLNGYSFFLAGVSEGHWSPASRSQYNLFDAVSRCTTQVYPNSWTAILVSVDNAGMWSLRSCTWERYYLGQQFYMRVRSHVHSTRDEYEIPPNAIMCGKLKNRLPIPPP